MKNKKRHIFIFLFFLIFNIPVSLSKKINVCKVVITEIKESSIIPGFKAKEHRCNINHGYEEVNVALESQLNQMKGEINNGINKIEANIKDEIVRDIKNDIIDYKELMEEIKALKKRVKELEER